MKKIFCLIFLITPLFGGMKKYSRAYLYSIRTTVARGKSPDQAFDFILSKLWLPSDADHYENIPEAIVALKGFKTVVEAYRQKNDKALCSDLSHGAKPLSDSFDQVKELKDPFDKVERLIDGMNSKRTYLESKKESENEYEGFLSWLFK